MTKKNLFLLLLISPLVMIIGINSLNPQPSLTYQKEQCSRYCHNVACLHFNQRFDKLIKQYPKMVFIRDVYQSNISWLKDNKLGLSYKEINLLIYVLGVPFALILLIWGAFRKKKHG